MLVGNFNIRLHEILNKLQSEMDKHALAALPGKQEE
jgi:hypothetical protein